MFQSETREKLLSRLAEYDTQAARSTLIVNEVVDQDEKKSSDRYCLQIGVRRQTDTRAGIQIIQGYDQRAAGLTAQLRMDHLRSRYNSSTLVQE